MEVTYTKWMCDYCAEEFESRPDCIKHKMHCGYNPEMRRCLTCGNAKVDKIRTGSKTTAFRFACTNNKLQNEATNTMGLQRACSYWTPKNTKEVEKPKCNKCLCTAKEPRIRDSMGGTFDIRCGDTIGVNLRTLLRYMGANNLPLNLGGVIMDVCINENYLKEMVSEDAVIPVRRLAYGGKVKLVEE